MLYKVDPINRHIMHTAWPFSFNIDESTMKYNFELEINLS